ncbi:unnamed protein product, partial [Rotaria magnacalcarata]
MVVANHAVNAVAIYFGQNSSSFSTPIQYPTGNGSTPYIVAVGDFNTDSILDIAVANFGITGDFNNDNYLDLAISNYGTDNVQILFGNESGTFAAVIRLSTGLGSHPNSITVGHFNQDVYLDIDVANYGTNQIGILLNNGNGTFANQVNYSTGSASPYSIGVGDFNQDNLLDLIATNNGTDNLAVFLGYGNGTFVQPRMYSTGASSSISFAVCDVNKDHRLDIIVV